MGEDARWPVPAVGPTTALGASSARSAERWWRAPARPAGRHSGL